MEKLRSFTVLFAIFAIAVAYPKEGEIHHAGEDSVNGSRTTTKIQYPEARRNESIIDNYNGTEIKDPYRWLEVLDSEETLAFINGQNALAARYLTDFPARTKINDTFQQVLNLSKQPKLIVKRDNKYYFLNGNFLKSRAIYVQDSLDSEPEIYLDCNDFDKNRTVGIAYFEFSMDGKILALELIDENFLYSVRFMNTETGTMYPEVLNNTVSLEKLTWTKDNKGIFYACNRLQDRVIKMIEELTKRVTREVTKKETKEVTKALRETKLFYHIVGTQISEDVSVTKIESPNLSLDATIRIPMIEFGNKLLVVAKYNSENHAVYQTKLSIDGNITGELNLTTVVGLSNVSYHYITNDGPNAIFLTNKNASKFQLISINLEDPAENKWTVLLPEDPDRHLDWVEPVDGDKFVACYIHYHETILQLHSLKTGQSLKTIFHDNGVIDEHALNVNRSEIFFNFQSLLTSGTVYTVDLANDQEPKISHQSEADKQYSQTHKMTQVFYPNKDGTRIPMIIVTRVDAVLNGSAPTFLSPNVFYSDTPMLTTLKRFFTQNLNGAFAIAGIRGSDDYVDWRNAFGKDGISISKQDAFDDFQYAAKYLIENNYTTPSKVVVGGHGVEGLDVAACINQRPDLFGAAIIENGLFDMLRYHKLGSKGWVFVYGNPDDPKDFLDLMKYSPLHNVKSPTNGSQFPATFFTISPEYFGFSGAHTLKMTATLQHHIGKLANQTNPILAKILTKSPDPVDKMVDTFNFITKALGLTLRS